MSPKTRGKLTVLAIASIFVLLLSSGVCLAFSKSGKINGPVPYTHTVKCNPGDSFSVKINSSHGTTANIIALTPYGNEWAENVVAKSPVGTAHYLEYKAPDGQPKNNAAYWHYKVSIRAATNEWTDFSLNIEQIGSGEKNQDETYVARAKKQINNLGSALTKNREARRARRDSLSDDMKRKEDRLAGERQELDREKTELNALVGRIKAETNKAARSDMSYEYKQKKARFDEKVIRFNDEVREIMALDERRNTEVDEIKKINDLLKALSEAYNKGDMDQCVLIANGSDLARSLGWTHMTR